jgi:hypothetical protein
MPPLRNTRREKFALAVAEGKSFTEAHQIAGYKPCRQNAARLMTFDDIKQRVGELQQTASQKSEITIQSLLEELEHARSRADSLGQLSASVKAITSKAQISGLLIERHEVGPPHSFDDCDSHEAVVKQLRELCGDRLTELFCLAAGVGEEGVKPDSPATYARKLGAFKRSQRVIEHIPAEQPQLSPADVERKRMLAERQKLYGGNGSRR